MGYGKYKSFLNLILILLLFELEIVLLRIVYVAWMTKELDLNIILDYF